MLTKILGTDAAHALESEPQEVLRDARASLPTPMLDLVMRSGHVESFNYAYLARVSFDPKGRLLLFFGDDVAVIEGRNLLDVRQSVRLHRTNEVCEGTEAEERLKPEGAAHIERMYVTTKQELEEESDDTRNGKGVVRQ
jgi:hypothetical protein